MHFVVLMGPRSLGNCVFRTFRRQEVQQNVKVSPYEHHYWGLCMLENNNWNRENSTSSVKVISWSKWFELHVPQLVVKRRCVSIKDGSFTWEFYNSTLNGEHRDRDVVFNGSGQAYYLYTGLLSI